VWSAKESQKGQNPDLASASNCADRSKISFLAISHIISILTPKEK
jgi:hypothetical protein